MYAVAREQLDSGAQDPLPRPAPASACTGRRLARLHTGSIAIGLLSREASATFKYNDRFTSWGLHALPARRRPARRIAWRHSIRVAVGPPAGGWNKAGGGWCGAGRVPSAASPMPWPRGRPCPVALASLSA
ncbi:hypothetical protein GCM10018793_43350 [Streptomyces sulfonofaciens]|uniref:Uncharacterized protein n=1 Tax=Streptomyces sulfonofaciens TaxID=68272 RepID=A0A919GFC2_9ACTN|nr:hypothetical protein GCM10018793_43350 [Streptomyces sulfonofaciens]